MKDYNTDHRIPILTKQCLTDGNALEYLNRAVDIIPQYPNGFEGQGIVICGGGTKYFACAWVCINMLRELGCKLPIDLWHLGEGEMTDEMRSLVEPLDVACINAREVQQVHPARILNGYEVKPYAIIHSRYREVIFIDADNVPVVDPTFLFNAPQYEQHGAIFWPDFAHFAPDRPVWRLTGVPYQDEPEFESGQIVVDKERCWRPLLLAMWMNEHSDFWYKHFLGDKETFHMAWRKLNVPYAMPSHRVEALHGTMCQHDFDGGIVFQHRNLAKFSLTERNHHIPGFKYEDLCLGFLHELHIRWGSKSPLPFCSDAATALESKLATELFNKRWLYRRVGYDERPMMLSQDGMIDEGSAGCEQRWGLTAADIRDAHLNIFGRDGLTCQLQRVTENHWAGRWEQHERMPVELISYGSSLNDCLNSVNHSLEIKSDLTTPSQTSQPRGIVTFGGGTRYFPCAWVLVNMLRQLGCTLPIEVWYRGLSEMSEEMRSLLESVDDVRCVDAFAVCEVEGIGRLGGWELKPFAIIHSAFAEVLALDSDNVPTQDPSFLFDDRHYHKYGAVFWPDRAMHLGDPYTTTRPEIWRLLGLDQPDEPEFEAGQILVDKHRCRGPLQMAWLLNQHSQVLFAYCFGDKETYHLAWRLCGQDFAMPQFAPADLSNGAVLYQHDFDGRRLFQHRTGAKWVVNGKNRRFSVFVHEDSCMRFVDVLKGVWDGRIRVLPEDFTASERATYDAIIDTAQFTYQQFGFGTRSMRLNADFTIGDGATDLEQTWRLDMQADGTSDLILENMDRTTCRLSYDVKENAWVGRYLHFERMPVALRPLEPIVEWTPVRL